MPSGIYPRKPGARTGRPPSIFAVPREYRQVVIYFNDCDIQLRQRIEKIIVDYNKKTGRRIALSRLMLILLNDFLEDVNDKQIIKYLKEKFARPQNASYTKLAKQITRAETKRKKEQADALD
jgi:hypothetical protein